MIMRTDPTYCTKQNFFVKKAQKEKYLYSKMRISTKSSKHPKDQNFEILFVYKKFHNITLEIDNTLAYMVLKKPISGHLSYRS